MLRAGFVAQEQVPGEAAGGDDRHLRRRTADNEHGGRGEHRDRESGRIGAKCLRHAPHRLGHHGDDDGAETVQQTGRNRIVERDDSVAKPDEQDCRRRGEAQPGRQRPRNSGLREPDPDPHLARRGAGKHLAQRDEVRVAALVRPPPADDERLPEVADVRDRSAEGGQAQREKGEEDGARGLSSCEGFCRGGI